MLLFPPFDVRRYAGVQRIVFTPGNINKPHPHTILYLAGSNSMYQLFMKFARAEEVFSSMCHPVGIIATLPESYIETQMLRP